MSGISHEELNVFHIAGSDLCSTKINKCTVASPWQHFMYYVVDSDMYFRT